MYLNRYIRKPPAYIYFNNNSIEEKRMFDKCNMNFYFDTKRIEIVNG